MLLFLNIFLDIVRKKLITNNYYYYDKYTMINIMQNVLRNYEKFYF